jgi:hypothetical protein
VTKAISKAISPLTEQIFELPGSVMAQSLPSSMKNWIADTAILFGQMTGHIEPEETEENTSTPTNLTDYSLTHIPLMTKCADEGETCECSTKIFYGHEYEGELNHRLSYKKKKADSSGQTSCSNTFFGDPLYGIPKTCFCSYDYQSGGIS